MIERAPFVLRARREWRTLCTRRELLPRHVLKTARGECITSRRAGLVVSPSILVLAPSLPTPRSASAVESILDIWSIEPGLRS